MKRRHVLLLAAASLSACIRDSSDSIAQVAPSPAIAPDTMRIAVISDLNSQYGSTDYEPEVDRAISLITQWRPNLVLCGGDMVAGQKTSLTTAEIRAMWESFDRHVANPLRQAGLPFGFTLGNHDASSAIANGRYTFERDRTEARNYWNAHDPGLRFVDRASFPFYYTFEQNGIFFLVWDASSAQIPPEQLAWVDRSLASPAAQAAKLRIAIGHLPLYAVAVGRDAPGEFLNSAESLRSLLERHNVHTYISGHNHAYYPGHVGRLELLYCGLLGSGARALLNGNLPPRKTLTTIDVRLETAETIYTTIDPLTQETIDQRTLPRLIRSSTGVVLRRDIRPEDLTAAERSL
ncbi:metallophosphoesterase [Microcoleus sp. FACHB-1515]|uniref:metallophosphoesterase family protein n=1 Tax=Cyanophyceae TaxID=3028117 RepID=UPI001685807A|nr:metallophosphoesterase [Microcoleus sp. FACHB-1515]MBD2092864.1 metallophosphoesterase [Microcoleus sp. FACHB-1515]